MTSDIFQQRCAYLSAHINDTLISLEELSIICVKGRDKKKYLNNHFTINLDDIHNDSYRVGAHCNIQGKVLAIFFIFRYYDCYLYVLRSSILPKHLQELKKYSLFSAVDISEEKNFFLYGLCGTNSIHLLEKFFSQEINQEKNFFVINYFVILKLKEPILRFLILVPQTELIVFLNFMRNQVVMSSDSQWIALDIESNFPICNISISGRFILQTIGLKKWNAIDFNKGCYYGQESLCKYENKKINKFLICSLIGAFSPQFCPVAREYIECKDLNGYIYQAGIVLSWTLVHNKKILLQVRMKDFFFKQQNRFFLSSCPNILFRLYIT